MTRLIYAFLAAAVLIGALDAQTAFNDRFNRANSGSLGPNWAEQDGNADIVGNKLQANSPFFFGWSMHTAYDEPYDQTVVRVDWSMNGGGGDRISIMAGVNAAWHGVEIRIADNNGDGLADRLFFNAMINAGTWHGGSLFHDLATPIASGRATMWFSNAGDTVNIEILDPTTGIAETFSGSGILALPPQGSSVAVGYFGNGTIDDFRAWTGSPTGTNMTLTPARVGQPLDFMITDSLPFGLVVLLSSVVGNNPQPTTIGPLFLSDPIQVATVVVPDANGEVHIPVPAPVAGAVGATVHLQGVDVGTQSLTNHFSVTIF